MSSKAIYNLANLQVRQLDGDKRTEYLSDPISSTVTDDNFMRIRKEVTATPTSILDDINTFASGAEITRMLVVWPADAPGTLTVNCDFDTAGGAGSTDSDLTVEPGEILMVCRLETTNNRPIFSVASGVGYAEVYMWLHNA